MERFLLRDHNWVFYLGKPSCFWSNEGIIRDSNKKAFHEALEVCRCRVGDNSNSHCPQGIWPADPLVQGNRRNTRTHTEFKERMSTRPLIISSKIAGTDECWLLSRCRLSDKISVVLTLLIKVRFNPDLSIHAMYLEEHIIFDGAGPK